jgi:hypothetical protein
MDINYVGRQEVEEYKRAIVSTGKASNAFLSKSFCTLVFSQKGCKNFVTNFCCKNVPQYKYELRVTLCVTQCVTL